MGMKDRKSDQSGVKIAGTNRREFYGGASTICRNGVVVRFAASDAPALVDTSDAIWSELRRALLGVPRPALRKY